MRTSFWTPKGGNWGVTGSMEMSPIDNGNQSRRGKIHCQSDAVMEQRERDPNQERSQNGTKLITRKENLWDR